MTRLEPTRDVLFVKFRKGDERYVFCGDKTPENVHALVSAMCQFASDPELSFSITDAVNLANRVWQETET